MGKCTERLYNGLVKENPTFVQMLGMCPTLAVTTSAINGAGMGLATTCILVLSNMMISALRKVIPDKVRIPSYIVIIASFVTIIQLLMQAYLPSLNDALGIYIPLIVVNCIILGRAESYASKNKVIPSMFDGIGMGLGFTVGLTIIGAFRELVGKGEIFGVKILGEDNVFVNMGDGAKTVGDVLANYTPITIFVLAPGAFFVLAFIIAFINRRNAVKKAKGKAASKTCKPSACEGCANMLCSGKLITDVEREAAEKAAAEKAAAEKAAAEKAAAEKAAAEKAEQETTEEKSGDDNTLNTETAVTETDGDSEKSGAETGRAGTDSEKSDAEADRAGTDSEKSDAEADRAGTDSEKSDAEADRAGADSEKSVTEEDMPETADDVKTEKTEAYDEKTKIVIPESVTRKKNVNRDNPEKTE